MAKVSPPAHVTKLMKVLRDRLKAAEIPATVESERIPTTRLYRIIVLAEKFKSMPHSDRQSLVWRIAESVLSVDEQLLISSILTLEPAEIGWTDKPRGKRAVRSTKTA